MSERKTDRAENPGMNGKPGHSGKPGTARKPGTTGKPGGTGKPGMNGKSGGTRKPGMNGKPGTSGKPGVRGNAGKEGKMSPGGNRTLVRKGPYGRPAPKKAVDKKPAEMEGLAARRVALQVLRQVTEEGAYASLSLDRALQGCGMSAADRRLASRLVYDTLDHLFWIDHVLSQVMAREDTDIRLRNILRLGVCQILLEDRIPESAATNTCVQLCVELGMEGLKGVCNGILRTLVRRKDELVFPDPEKEPDEAAALQYSLPLWLWRQLKEDWGAEEAEKIAAYRNLDGGWTIRPNLTRVDDASFEELLGKKIWGRTKLDILHAWQITGAVDLARDADFLAGHFSIQSASSMLVCEAMAPKRGKQYLDCCAAPGGKACYLAELMDGTGRVQAWDVHEHRTALIEAQAHRLGLENIRPMVRDALKPREDLNMTMDGVLLDAPCSGMGVLAEKPDIRLRLTEEGVQALVETQKRLLDTVCAYVKLGGTLVYSTCSLLKAECEEQARGFLARHPEFEEIPLPDTIPQRLRAYQSVGLQLLPYRDGMEGFYLCRMRRRS